MATRTQPAFAVWITGLPSSGKSTVAAALARQLEKDGIDVAILESDALRPILTPQPTYDDRERDVFYSAMTYIGSLLVRHGVPVIFDATANRRKYRDEARGQIHRFVEVYVDCPLSVCMARDPKGIYRKAQEHSTNHVPGLQAAYEKPENPDVIVNGEREPPQAAAGRIVARLAEQHFLENRSSGA